MCINLGRVRSFQKIVGFGGLIGIILRVIWPTRSSTTFTILTILTIIWIRGGGPYTLAFGLTGLGSSFTFGNVDAFSVFQAVNPWGSGFDRRLGWRALIPFQVSSPTSLTGYTGILFTDRGRVRKSLI